ncbi:MAG TPA: hypothetical protein VGM37_02200 [Armatimonadota bacterium]|jgi:phytoene/squalene synthetase
MYIRNIDDDDDCTLHTRGDDLRNHLRRASATIGRMKDPEAQEAMGELLEAFRVVTEILYDLSDPTRRPLHVTSANSPYSLS